MLDGLLGRSAFTSKCKSLIKPTRTRIDALRKRADAKQRFLKQDLAKLLANGLDLNAYGRTEEFIAGLNLLSCYTFIDQSCEYIYKQLSIMQKLGQCPEECRETVASLMFAAARFSDLPELRDLRDVFQDRYGNGLECFVNQVFVDKLASKPPTMEKRIKLLQDIATEFSIQWDSKGFKQRMDKPATLAQDQPKKLGPPSVSDDKYKLPNGNSLFRKNDQRSKEKDRIEHFDQGATLHNNGNGSLSVTNDKYKLSNANNRFRKNDQHAKDKERIEHADQGEILHSNGNRALSVADDKYKLSNGNNRFRKSDQYFEEKERIEHVDLGATLHNNGNGNVRRREVFVGREDKHHKERIDHDRDGGNENVRRREVFVGREDSHHKERIDNDHHDGNENVRRREVFVGREAKHHKERIDHDHDDGNENVRRKEVFVVREEKQTRKEDSDGYFSNAVKGLAYENHDRMSNDDDRVNIGRKERHGYKQEAFPNIGRKERHGYKQEAFPSSSRSRSRSRSRAETIETRDNNDDHLFRGRHDKTSSSSSSRAETIETKDKNDDHLFRERQDMKSSNDRPDIAFLKGEKPHLLYNGKSQGISNRNGEDDVIKVHEEEASRFKSRYNNSLPPPPYVKPNIPPPPYSKPHNSERMKKEVDHDRDYPNDIPLPKPRSIRRKHRSKSSSSHDEDVGSSEDARIVKRISSSRRKERRGLQILFDDQHYHHRKEKDQEEKMMDKLLLHYSSKKTSYDDITKLRKKKSPSRSKDDDQVEMIVPPMRSISLPHEPSGELEAKKVYARANSFHPDNQAKHVHPKLPDYDDLAARFAALRGQ